MINMKGGAFMNRAHVCPWWFCFTFDNPLRRLFHNPEAILSPYIRPGATAIDVGPGMGFFTVAMCRLAGKKGRVIAADLQQKMLDGVMRRVRRFGLADRLKTVRSTPADLRVSGKADFVLAFWMVHEAPDKKRFLGQIAALLKPKGRFLLAEPYVHVPKKAFELTLEAAKAAGLKMEGTPRIAFSRSALFTPG